MNKKLILTLFFIWSSLIYPETIKIAITSYEPLIIIEGKKVSGVFIEIIDEAFKKVGITTSYEAYPWKRAQEVVEKNKMDAVIPLFKTADREKKFLFSDPVMIAVNKFFYMRGNNIPDDFKWNSLADFKKFTVGGVIGYWYLEGFEKAGIKPELVVSDDLNLQKLYTRRIDTFVGDEIFGWGLIKKYYPDEKNKFATLEKPESELARYVVFNKTSNKSKDFLEKFNKGLSLLKKSGEYEKILKKYMIEPHK